MMILDEKNFFLEYAHFFKLKLAICEIPVGKTGGKRKYLGFLGFWVKRKGSLFQAKNRHMGNPIGNSAPVLRPRPVSFGIYERMF